MDGRRDYNYWLTTNIPILNHRLKSTREILKCSTNGFYIRGGIESIPQTGLWRISRVLRRVEPWLGTMPNRQKAEGKEIKHCSYGTSHAKACNAEST